VDDVAEDAAVMSRAVSRPVRVQWMRDDEHAWETKGPPHVQRVRAGVDAQGRIVAWDFMDRTFPWTVASDRPGIYLLASRLVGFRAVGEGATNGQGCGGQIYDFENKKVVAALISWMQPDETPLRTGNLRAPGDPARCFASETFLDHIASELGVDPVELRRRYLTGNVRAAKVLEAAAQRAGWQPRRARRSGTGDKAAGRGVALSARANTYVATVADVEVDKPTGKITVKRMTVAHDCGLIVNPDGLRNQIEGNTIQGVSRTLLEEVQFDGSGVKSLDWRSYPILTFQDVPDVDIVLINQPDLPMFAAGEPAITPVAAAIANAVFDATGVRLREIPLTPQRVRVALKATSA
jgi:CO/xanthine dehydrogenase Mo-binding subunit